MLQRTLKPIDVPVALTLAVEPDASYAAIASDLGISASTAFAAVGRLREAGLLQPDSRTVNRRALLEFLEHGVRYAFPARKGRPARGVPTAHSAPPLANRIVAEDALVWPHAGGSVYGQTLTPLYPGAPVLAERAPEEYRLLTLVDAVRAGGARERALAIEELRAALYR